MQELQRSVTVVGNQHHFPPGQPAAQLQNQLARPREQRFRGTRLVRIVSRRRCQRREDWQGPDARSPRDIRQPHETDPAQATGLHEVATTRTNRVAINAARFDTASPAAFDGLVDTEHQRLFTTVKMLQEQRQQHLAHLARRPGCTIEYMMEFREVAVRAQTHTCRVRQYSVTRNAAVTVRRRGVRIEPTNSTCALNQVRLSNTVANGLSKSIISVGKVSIFRPFFAARSELTLPFYL